MKFHGSLLHIRLVNWSLHRHLLGKQCVHLFLILRCFVYIVVWYSSCLDRGIHMWIGFSIYKVVKRGIGWGEVLRSTCGILWLIHVLTFTLRKSVHLLLLILNWTKCLLVYYISSFLVGAICRSHNALLASIYLHIAQFDRCITGRH